VNQRCCVSLSVYLHSLFVFLCLHCVCSERTRDNNRFTDALRRRRLGGYSRHRSIPSCRFVQLQRNEHPLNLIHFRCVRYSCGLDGRSSIPQHPYRLGPTQPHTQWVPGVKRPVHEADPVPTSRMAELFLHSPIRLHGVLLS
jgi:hypothetical protein